MRSLLANLRNLLLPFDAGPGDPRVSIDGENGRIVVYGPGGTLRGLIDDSGIWFASGSETDVADIEDSEGYIRLRRVSDSRMRLELTGDDLANEADFQGGAQLTVLRGGDEYRLTIRSPDTHAGAQAAEILLGQDRVSGENRVRLACNDLEIAPGGGGNGGPIITVSGTTDGFGGLTFSHGAASTPRLILPIMEDPVAHRVNAIDGITATEATAWTSLASDPVEFRALVVT